MLGVIKNRRRDLKKIAIKLEGQKSKQMLVTWMFGLPSVVVVSFVAENEKE